MVFEVQSVSQPRKTPWVHVRTSWSHTNILISRWRVFDYALNLNGVNIPLHCHMHRIYVGFNSFIWWALVNMFPVCRCRHLFWLSQGWVTEKRVTILTGISCHDVCFIVNGHWKSCGYYTKYFFYISCVPLIRTFVCSD